MAEFVSVRCLQTGFRARLPVETWQSYTEEQRASYEVVEGQGAVPVSTEEADDGEVGK
jgi:hypothetical protein